MAEGKMVITAIPSDLKRVEELLDVVEAVARCRLESTFPISSLCLVELAQHGKAAQEELDRLAALEIEAQAKKAEEQKKEADALAAKEAAANQAGVRRDLPPLSAPPTR